MRITRLATCSSALLLLAPVGIARADEPAKTTRPTAQPAAEEPGINLLDATRAGSVAVEAEGPRRRPDDHQGHQPDQPHASRSSCLPASSPQAPPASSVVWVAWAVVWVAWAVAWVAWAAAWVVWAVAWAVWAAVWAAWAAAWAAA